MDHGRAALVDLAAQVGDVELDDVGLAAEVVVPDAVEDLRLGQHAARVAHEVPQELELGRGEPDLLAPAPPLVRVLVELEVADDEHRVLALGGRTAAAQQPAQPGDDLFQAERLGHVVVAARGEPGDAVLDGVARGEEQHGHVGVALAQAAQDGEPVHVGEHDVEHDDVRPGLPRGADRGVPVERGGDVPALVPQRRGEQLGEVRLVVDHEDADGGAVRAREARLVRAADGGGGCGHAPRVARDAEACLW
ncbi:Uncharacterised protein [Mycobacteroides abscessus]|nr:Uncharacterised protein [Mycobacteroides abscessus]